MAPVINQLRLNTISICFWYLPSVPTFQMRFRYVFGFQQPKMMRFFLPDSLDNIDIRIQNTGKQSTLIHQNSGIIKDLHTLSDILYVVSLQTCQYLQTYTVSKKGRSMIYSLEFLQKTSTENCEQIDLGQNFIEDLTLLSRLRLTRLRYLNLATNMISSLEVFARTHLPQLVVLDVQGNHIVEIDPLVSCGLFKLRQLKLGQYVRGNQISNLACMRRSRWAQLECLYLDSNNVEGIVPLQECVFTRLTHLYLGNNRISIVQHQYFQKFISLKGNQLATLRFLHKCYFPEIEYINLSANCISQISTLFRVNFPKLTKLNLSQNKLCWMNDAFKCKFPNLSTIVQSDYDILIYRETIEKQLYQKFIAGPMIQ